MRYYNKIQKEGKAEFAVQPPTFTNFSSLHREVTNLTDAI